jgi:hypothetical protein
MADGLFVSIRNTLFFGLLAMLLPGCNDERAFDCVKSAGSLTSDIREVGPFSVIMLHDNVDLLLTNQANTTATIEAGRNLLPKIRLETRGDTLFIFNTNTCNWTRSYKRGIRVTLGVQQENLTVQCMGYGDVSSSDTLQVGSLSVLSLEGGSDIRLNVAINKGWFYTNSHSHMQLAGTAESSFMWINRGIGRISAEALRVQQCHALNNGNNEIRVYPIQELVAEIPASGTVAYYHEPASLTSIITGSGKLVRR